MAGRRAIPAAERIERAIRNGEPTVLRLLFWDAEAEGVDWQVAVFGADGSRHGLILTYRADGERRVLAALRALAGGHGRQRETGCGRRPMPGRGAPPLNPSASG